MKLTETEKIILNKTNKQYKYIARDLNGDLYLYVSKPEKRSSYWIENFFETIFCISDKRFSEFNHLFQSIQWEDEEPYKFR